MSSDDFANCMKDRLSIDADEVKKLGDDVWKQLSTWWEQVPEWAKLYLAAIAGKNTERLAKAIAVIFGLEVADVLVALGAGVAVGAILDGVTECAGKL
jgi:hypothetical protein